MNVFGLDGAPQGWSVAYQDSEGRILLTLVRDLSEFIHRFPQATHVAIDMIIGLPEHAKKGGREAEKEARKLLSPRGSVVFSSPCRDAVYAQDYPEALNINRQSSPDCVGLSKQSFNITPKIKEVDRFLQQHTSLRSLLHETHPELSFWEMNHRKPLKSKHSPEGKDERRALLRQYNILPTAHMSKDDVDAIACLWSALRIQRGESQRIPFSPPLDRLLLPMKITW